MHSEWNMDPFMFPKLFIYYHHQVKTSNGQYLGIWPRVVTSPSAQGLLEKNKR